MMTDVETLSRDNSKAEDTIGGARSPTETQEQRETGEIEPAVKPKPIAPILGEFESFDGTYLTGWARYPESESVPELTIRIDSEKVGQAICSDTRGDLEAAGIGPFAFKFRVPEEWIDGEQHEILLTEAKTSTVVLQSPHTIKLEHQALQGNLDTLIGNRLHGWARRPERTVSESIKLSIDGRVIGEFEAAHPRADLTQSGVGHHAFEIEIPIEYMDGNIHEISIIDKKRRELTLNSPHSMFLDCEKSAVSPEKIGGRSKPNILKGPARKPTVLSVIIPTYNRASTLKATLDALARCKESSPGTQIIVVDDGSTDDTLSLLGEKQWKDAGITSHSIPNGGPGQARNHGVGRADGELVMFLGDDTVPTDPEFFNYHIDAHRKYPGVEQAVLGKIIWPNQHSFQHNMVTSIIQGDGQQQFGYKYMTPWTWYEWPMFYTANISIKKSLVKNWELDGFSKRFYLAAFEDAEFAYRMKKKHGQFRILYTPHAVVEHHHPYTLEGFMRRQVNCGMMMKILLEIHPELEEMLVPAAIRDALGQSRVQSADLPIEHYFAIIEGLKSWALVIEKHYSLGSQNWHGDLANSIFNLCVQHGYLMAKGGEGGDVALAYRKLLEQLRGDLNRAISTEALGHVEGFGMI